MSAPKGRLGGENTEEGKKESKANAIGKVKFYGTPLSGGDWLCWGDGGEREAAVEKAVRKSIETIAGNI